MACNNEPQWWYDAIYGKPMEKQEVYSHTNVRWTLPLDKERQDIGSNFVIRKYNDDDRFVVDATKLWSLQTAQQIDAQILSMLGTPYELEAAYTEINNLKNQIKVLTQQLHPEPQPEQIDPTTAYDYAMKIIKG